MVKDKLFMDWRKMLNLKEINGDFIFSGFIQQINLEYYIVID